MCVDSHYVLSIDHSDSQRHDVSTVAYDMSINQDVNKDVDWLTSQSLVSPAPRTVVFAYYKSHTSVRPAALAGAEVRFNNTTQDGIPFSQDHVTASTDAAVGSADDLDAQFTKEDTPEAASCSCGLHS